MKYSVYEKGWYYVMPKPKVQMLPGRYLIKKQSGIIGGEIKKLISFTYHT
ncbi:MAG: hypothetical protein GY714_06245 [Desulfobacterales bacterium]|nr:hypothetical protein [Desulfobacterales bacterium]